MRWTRRPNPTSHDRGNPWTMTAWGLALLIGLLSPFLARLHTEAHRGHESSAHPVALHQSEAQSSATSGGCVQTGHMHRHGPVAHASTQATPHRHAHPAPAHHPHPESPTDCPTCLELGLVGKLKDLPPVALDVPLAELVAPATTRPVASRLPARAPGAFRPRAPPTTA